MKKVIEEINALAIKQREQGLTDQEKERQAQVRQIYLDAVKKNFRSQLEGIKVVDKDEKTAH